MRRLLAAAGLVLAVAVGGCASAEPPPTPAMVRVIGAMPTSVEIASIGVRSTVPLVPLGLDARGQLASPPLAHPEVGGWYEDGVRPGDVGPAVIAAHVNGNGRAGLFARLAELKAGADIRVGREDGSTAVFRVNKVETYPKDRFPTEAVYRDTHGPEIRLITCGGELDRAAHSYRSNVVAYGVLVEIVRP